MIETFVRSSIACAMLALLAMGSVNAGDSTSKGDPPPPPADGSQPPPPPPGHGHGHRPPPSADMFFKRFDANKDGVVTYDEFVKGHANPPPPPPPAESNGKDSPPPPPPPMTEDQLKERFNSLDANGDGKITRDEYEAAIKRGPPPPGQGHKR